MNLNTFSVKSSCVRALLVGVAGLAVGCSPPPGGADEAITQALNLDDGHDTDLFGSEGGHWVRTACPGGGGTCSVLFPLPLVRHDAQGKGRLERVFVWAGSWIDGIQFAWRSPDGGLIESPVAGTPKDGHFRNPLILEADEFIIRITGRHGKYVDRLQITTNKRVHPAWGGGGGDPFDVNRTDTSTGEQIHGFQTRSGQYLDQIGFIIYPN